MRSSSASWQLTKEEFVRPVKLGGTSFEQGNIIRKSVYVLVDKIAKKLTLYVSPIGTITDLSPFTYAIPFRSSITVLN